MEDTKSRFKRICVFCGSSSGKKASYQEAAVELGKELVMKQSYFSLFVRLYIRFQNSKFWKLMEIWIFRHPGVFVSGIEQSCNVLVNGAIFRRINRQNIFFHGVSCEFYFILFLWSGWVCDGVAYCGKKN